MNIQKTSMSQARAHFAEALASATSGGVVLVQRRGMPDAAIVDAELLEDFMAATNPRIIKKVAAARARKELYSAEEVFGDLW